MARIATQSKLKEFALIAARMRIQELQAEIDRIKRQFEGRTLGISTRGTGQSGLRPEPAARAIDGGSDAGNGRKRTMSAAARKRISDAQKARWAKWKRARTA